MTIESKQTNLIYDNRAEQLRKYNLWLKPQTLQNATANLPKQVIAYLKRQRKSK